MNAVHVSLSVFRKITVKLVMLALFAGFFICQEVLKSCDQTTQDKLELSEYQEESESTEEKEKEKEIEECDDKLSHFAFSIVFDQLYRLNSLQKEQNLLCRRNSVIETPPPELR